MPSESSPRSLGFGPTNGPEDFSRFGFRTFRRKLFKTWFLFIDDVLVATGRGQSLEEAVSEDQLAQALDAVGRGKTVRAECEGEGESGVPLGSVQGSAESPAPPAAPQVSGPLIASPAGAASLPAAAAVSDGVPPRTAQGEKTSCGYFAGETSTHMHVLTHTPRSSDARLGRNLEGPSCSSDARLRMNFEGSECSGALQHFTNPSLKSAAMDRRSPPPPSRSDRTIPPWARAALERSQREREEAAAAAASAAALAAAAAPAAEAANASGGSGDVHPPADATVVTKAGGPPPSPATEAPEGPAAVPSAGSAVPPGFEAQAAIAAQAASLAQLSTIFEPSPDAPAPSVGHPPMSSSVMSLLQGVLQNQAAIMAALPAITGAVPAAPAAPPAPAPLGSSGPVVFRWTTWPRK